MHEKPQHPRNHAKMPALNVGPLLPPKAAEGRYWLSLIGSKRTATPSLDETREQAPFSRFHEL
jgi:hypothetical protein